MRSVNLVFSFLGLGLAALASAPGCTGKGAPPSAKVAPAVAPAPRVAADAPAVAARPPRIPSWRREIMPYLAQRCASARGCHGNNKTRHVDLDLRPVAAYKSLVNVESDERLRAKLVAPGDPDASFLVAKLLGKLRDREGTAMPRDEQDDRPVSPIPFDPDFIDNALVPWIKAGAPAN
jgi:hypothetical protein